MQGQSVAQVCEQLSIKPHILRYWEEQIPWLSPERSMSGHRLYGESHLHRLFRLKYLIEQRGFTLQGAAEQLIRENTGDAVSIKSRLQPLRHQLLDIRQRITDSQVPQPTGDPGHSVERYLPGITGISMNEQLRILSDYTAFRPEFRLPLVEFLYATGSRDTPLRTNPAAYRVSREVIRPESSTERRMWYGDRDCPLLILSPVYNGGTLSNDIKVLVSALRGSRHSIAVLLCEPGSAETYAIAAKASNALPDRCVIQSLPVFPDVTPPNRLLITPKCTISQYYPGPGIALQSACGDDELFRRFQGLSGRHMLLWYRPVGLPTAHFSMPTLFSRDIMGYGGWSAAAAVRRSANGSCSILPSLLLRRQDGCSPALHPGLQGSGVIAETIPTVNRLDKTDDIVNQEVCRVRSSVTDIVQRSQDVALYLEA